MIQLLQNTPPEYLQACRDNQDCEQFQKFLIFFIILGVQLRSSAHFNPNICTIIEILLIMIFENVSFMSRYIHTRTKTSWISVAKKSIKDIHQTTRKRNALFLLDYSFV